MLLFWYPQTINLILSIVIFSGSRRNRLDKLLESKSLHWKHIRWIKRISMVLVDFHTRWRGGGVRKTARQRLVHGELGAERIPLWYSGKYINALFDFILSIIFTFWLNQPRLCCIKLHQLLLTDWVSLFLSLIFSQWNL